MSYDPISLMAELRDYQTQADEAVEGNLIYHEEFHPYGSTVARETTCEAPDEIVLDTLDDILPLRVYTHELTYKLESINGSQATYRYHT